MVSAAEPVIAALERNWEMIDAALEGLDEATMASQPNGQSNSAAWVLWHLTRVTDTFIHTRLRDLNQLWIKDGWHEKFGMAADAEDRGVGWTAAQVEAWSPPSKDVQLGYYEAVKGQTRDYLANVSEEELAREIVLLPRPDPRTIAACMGQMVWDSVAHGGQIAYLRGYYGGMGWNR
jgi:uncharacterized damage-inducible protein DinB